MPVNPNSQIPLWLEDFNEAFYISITDKEDWALLNYPTGAQNTTILDYFSSMAAAMESYKTTSRFNEFYSFLGIMYQYYLARMNFNADIIDFDDFTVDKVFSLGNFIEDTLSRPVNYYNDLTQASPADPYLSPRLEADVTYLQNSAISDENALMTSLSTPLTNATQKVISKSLFEDVPPSPAPVGKQDTGDFIFNTQNYKSIYGVLNVAPLELPSYIVP